MVQIFKKFGIPVIILSYIVITIFQFIEYKDSETSLFELATSVIVGFLFVAQLCYSNYYYLFKNYHKSKLFVLNPTVKWRSVTKITLEKPIDFEEKNRQFYNELSEKTIDVKRVSGNNQDFKIKIDDSNISIHYDFNNTITIKYSSKVAYRDSLKEFERLVDRLLERYTANLQIESDKNYELDISFLSQNPFYKLNVKHLEENQIDKFNLKATIDLLSIEVTKNRMIIRSNDKDSILEASKDYFAL